MKKQKQLTNMLTFDKENCPNRDERRHIMSRIKMCGSSEVLHDEDGTVPPFTDEVHHVVVLIPGGSSAEIDRNNMG